MYYVCVKVRQYLLLILIAKTITMTATTNIVTPYKKILFVIVINYFAIILFTVNFNNYSQSTHLQTTQHVRKKVSYDIIDKASNFKISVIVNTLSIKMFSWVLQKHAIVRQNISPKTCNGTSLFLRWRTSRNTRLKHI